MYATIDPGLSTGWSLWSLSGLVACGLGDPRSCPLHRVAGDGQIDLIHDVWIEEPVIYPHSRTPPNDIRKLAMAAARWGGIYEASAVAVHFVTPSEWKGQVPKDVHHARAWAALSESARSIVDLACKGVAPSKRHNVLDAVAMGLWVRR